MPPLHSDPRKLVVTEFRILFNAPSVSDIVFNLDTEAGITAMQKSPFTIKEGAEYKFRISFRVNHEILAGLKFINKTSKMGLSNTDSVTIGSFAPASEPHVSA